MFDTLLVKQFTINNNVYYLQIHSSYYEKFLATGEVKCIDDEIPFEIPQGWEWEKLGNIASICGGKRIPVGKSLTTVNTGHKYIRVTDMKNHSVNSNDIHYITEDIYQKIKAYYISKEDLYITVAGTIGHIGEIPEEFDNANLTENANKIVFRQIDKKFLMYCLSSDVVQSQITAFITKVGQPKLAIMRIQNLLIPVPPLKEQFRIVNAINLTMPFVNRYESLSNDLSKLNISIFELLKKSILQEAIQGKLVTQIAEEGTAQELLEQIRKEKQKLVKEGKLKKSALTDSVIYKGDDNKYFEKNGKIEKDITNEIPFEIPDTWAWSRLSNLVILLSGRDLEPTQYNSVSKGIPYMTGASNFRNGSLIKNRWTETPIVISILGDLLITCKGTIGEMSFNTIGDIHIARQIMALRSSFVNLKYIQDYLSANIQDLQKQANSMIPGISRDTLLNALVPLPPLIEQARIVSKIKQLASIMRG